MSVANSAVIAILSVGMEEEEKKQQSGLLGGSTEEQIWFYLLGKGFSKEVVAGIMGNMFQESGLDSTSVTGRAAGLCMWQDYQAKAGRLDVYKRQEHTMEQHPKRIQGLEKER